MAEWRTPVFDRSMNDVKSVDRTSATYQKGALNADDLNRIEDNYKYLMAKLKSDAVFIPHRLRNFTETVLEYVEKENSILPSGYTQVEYIQSSGTQYINTAFIPNGNTKVVMDAQMTNYTGTYPAFFGVFNTNNYSFLDPSSSSDYYCYYYGNQNTGTTMSGVDRFSRSVITTDKNIVTYQGTSVSLTASTFDVGLPLYLFGANNKGSFFYVASMKLYSCQIYDNGTLIRDYVPCTNVNGTAGLYDLVNSAFYANAGSGSFATGAEIKKDTIYELTEIKTTYTDWQENNLPWLSEINRIRANYNALVRLFLVGLGLPVMAESNYLDYLEVNNWERIADVSKKMFENMEKEYRYCGMEESGGDRLL